MGLRDYLRRRKADSENQGNDFVEGDSFEEEKDDAEDDQARGQRDGSKSGEAGRASTAARPTA